VSTTEHPAAGDCEQLRAGFIAQPVNAASSLAFIAAAAWLWARLGERRPPGAAAYCALLAANGVGGVAFHGPGDRASHWLHDTALVATLGAIGIDNVANAVERDWSSSTPATGAVTAVSAIAVAAAPTATNAAAVVGSLIAFGGEAVATARGRSRARQFRRAGVLMAAASAVNAVSRTGGRCCRPSSRWQGHALWHVLTAASLAAWGAAAFDGDAEG
jgi:hypothetical protein